MHFLHATLDSIAGRSERGHDSAAVAGLFEHLADRRLFRRFTFVGLALGRCPIVVLRTMDDQDPDLAFGRLAEDDSPSRTNESCHGGDSRSEYP